MDERLNLIYSRRSIRSYKPDPVAPELIEELLRAAMAAPSAHNGQPWRFLVITDAEKRRVLSETHPYAKFAKDTPVVIFVYGTPEGPLFEQDLAAATQNLLVAAAGLGLGTCWCGVTDERRPALHSVSSIPEEYRIVSMVCVGHPAEEKEARSQYDPAKVKYGEF